VNARHPCAHAVAFAQKDLRESEIFFVDSDTWRALSCAHESAFAHDSPMG
jgi:hypothetical protein